MYDPFNYETAPTEGYRGTGMIFAGIVICLWLGAIMFVT